MSGNLQKYIYNTFGLDMDLAQQHNEISYEYLKPRHKNTRKNIPRHVKSCGSIHSLYRTNIETEKCRAQMDKTINGMDHLQTQGIGRNNLERCRITEALE